MKNIKKIINDYQKGKKNNIRIYLIIRLLVIICIIAQALRKEYENVFLCLLYLIVLSLPIIIQNKFKIELPNLLEGIISIFIFSGTILGSVYNFFGYVPYWDTILHTINGFICAGIGFSLIDLLNKNSKLISLSPIFVILVAFCFSMTVGVIWELYEYGADKIFMTDMQDDDIINTISSIVLEPDGKRNPIVVDSIDKMILYDSHGNELAVINGYLDIGLNDTMKDLIVNLIGAVIFSIFGYFYIANREKYKFTQNFIPKKIKNN